MPSNGGIVVVVADWAMRSRKVWPWSHLGRRRSAHWWSTMCCRAVARNAPPRRCSICQSLSQNAERP